MMGPDKTVHRTCLEGVILIKNVFFALLQFVLFLLVAFIGIALPALHMIPSNIMKFGDGSRGFEWDGVILMLILFVIILVIEALRKRLRSAAPWTFVALLLAAIVEYAMKLGVRDL
jgi:uncharacterized BrkB/YihY/UPF0761 family membrane protein